MLLPKIQNKWIGNSSQTLAAGRQRRLAAVAAVPSASPTAHRLGGPEDQNGQGIQPRSLDTWQTIRLLLDVLTVLGQDWQSLLRGAAPRQWSVIHALHVQRRKRSSHDRTLSRPEDAGDAAAYAGSARGSVGQPALPRAPRQNKMAAGGPHARDTNNTTHDANASSLFLQFRAA